MYLLGMEKALTRSMWLSSSALRNLAQSSCGYVFLFSGVKDAMNHRRSIFHCLFLYSSARGICLRLKLMVKCRGLF